MNVKYLTAKQAREMKVAHSDFRYVTEDGFDGFPVVVFERPQNIEPTQDQRDHYQRNKKIVTAHGGQMLLSEHECAGQTPVYTAEDCAAMRAAVEASLPDWEIRGGWNGERCRTYSISIARRETK